MKYPLALNVLLFYCLVLMACKKQTTALPVSDFSWKMAEDGSGKVWFKRTSIVGNNTRWDFGDNSKGTADSLYHQYMKSGNYVVQMFCQTSSGYETIKKEITVSIFAADSLYKPVFFKAMVKQDNITQLVQTDSGSLYIAGGLNSLNVPWKGNSLAIQFKARSLTDTLVIFGLNNKENSFMYQDKLGILYTINNQDSLGTGYFKIAASDSGFVTGSFNLKCKSANRVKWLEINNGSFRLKVNQ